MVVSAHDDDDGDLDELKDATGDLFMARRTELNHRKMVMKGHVIVSDDMAVAPYEEVCSEPRA